MSAPARRVPRGLELGDRELVRIVCNGCGSTIARVVQSRERRLVLVRCVQVRQGDRPSFRHEWEREPLNEALLAEFRRDEAPGRIAMSRTSCPKANCATDFAISLRQLAGWLQEADRRGRFVRWTLGPEDRELNALHQRMLNTRMIPADERPRISKLAQREPQPTTRRRPNK